MTNVKQQRGYVIQKKREDSLIISDYSLWPLLESFGRFYRRKKFLYYQILYTFHCTYKYYVCVSVVSVLFCRIHTPSNAVIEHPLFDFAMKIAKVCTYHQGEWGMAMTTRYEGKLFPWTDHLHRVCWTNRKIKLKLRR